MKKKTAWIRKVNFEIYDVTPGQQRISIHILLNISRIKDNQTMKFVLLIEYSKRNIFLQKTHAENDAGKLVPDRLFLFSKSFILGKSKWSAA